jgi:hypothetical protein
MSLLQIILSHFFRQGKPSARYRDVKTGRFVSGTMYRTAFGIKQLPLNHKYYGVVFYAWSKEPLENWMIETLYVIFKDELTSYLGYSEGEWWFSIFEQKNFKMKLNPSLIGMWRFKVDYRGVAIYERQSDY